jgi:hypothetical protein
VSETPQTKRIGLVPAAVFALALALGLPFGCGKDPIAKANATRRRDSESYLRAAVKAHAALRALRVKAPEPHGDREPGAS